MIAINKVAIHQESLSILKYRRYTVLHVMQRLLGFIASIFTMKIIHNTHFL